ncbi:MAG: hypothetical protein ABGX16_03715 [Pirellulales bacterium]
MRSLIIIAVLLTASTAEAGIYGSYGRYGNRVMFGAGAYGNRVSGLTRALRTQPVRRVRRAPRAVYYYRY